MDSPDGISTNIYLLGELPAVKWTLFRISSSLNDEGTESLASQDLTNHELVTGKCQYLQLEERLLWAFDLPESFLGQCNDDEAFSNHHDQLSTTQELLEISSGTLDARNWNTLDSESRININVHGKRTCTEQPDDVTEIKTEESTQDISLVTNSADLSSPQSSIATDAIYKYLLRSIKTECMRRLTRSQRYISIGSGLFCSRNCDTFSGPPEPVRHAQSCYRSLCRVWSLDVFWHKDNPVLLCCNPLPGQRVYSNRRTQASSRIILAPFGWIASSRSESTSLSFPDTINFQDPAQDLAGPLWQNTCLNILLKQGVILEDPSEWLKVTLVLRDDHTMSIVMEWPGELCFYLEGSTPQKPTAWKSALRWKDPINEASDWFTNAKVREKLVSDQKQAKARAEALSAEQQRKDQEDIPSHLLSKRGDDGLEPHVLAGIYPTPPDASKSHGNPHSESQPIAADAFEDADTMDTNHLALDESSPNLDDRTAIQGYDSLKDDDLFADMDGEMNDNGVTEDDFRFFDEPDEFEPPVPDSLPMDPPTEAEVKHENANDSIKDKLDKEELVQSVSTTPEDIIMADPVHETVDDHVNDLQSAALASNSHDVHNTVLLPEVNSKETARIMVVNQQSPLLAFTNFVQNLDDKYALRGKFASFVAIPPSTTKPGLSIAPEARIPLIKEQLILSPTSTDSPMSGFSSQVQTGLQDSDERTQDSSRKKLQLLVSIRDNFFVFDVKVQSGLGGMKSTMSTDSISPVLLAQHESSFVQLAQLVADQSVSYGHLSKLSDSVGDPKNYPLTDSPLHSILQQRFPELHSLTLQQCAAIGSGTSTAALQLPASMIRVLRGDHIMDMSIIATDFWKELSLRPLDDTKDITAFCICADTDMYQSGAVTLLRRLEDNYRTLNLGTHQSGHSLLTAYPDGLVTIPGLETTAMNIQTSETFDCSAFGKALSNLSSLTNTIVLYIVNPSDNDSSLLPLCSLFWKIFEAYASTFRKSDSFSDLVLQIIPKDLVTSGLQGVLKSSQQLDIFSKMIYDRCPVTQAQTSAYASGSLIQLSEPLPESIDFKLSSDNLSHSFGPQEVFHVAISYKEGQQWLSVAMIDACGSKQWSASYYLGEYSDPATPVSAIVKEIWEIIRDASLSRKKYSIYLVKTSKWSLVEIEAWKSLAAASKITLSMIVYDTQSPVVIISPPSSLDGITIEQDVASTIVATPDVSSPDAGPGKTEESDTVTRLVDSSNQSWWLPSKEIMLMDGDSFKSEQHMSSGYLIFGGTSVAGLYLQDTTHAMDISTVAEAYHGLRSLARARHVHDKLPWHIAVAETAQDGLLRIVKDARMP